MLKWFDARVWLDADKDGGGAGGEGEGGNGNGDGQKPEDKAAKTFTQADVDRIVGERAKRAEESAIAALLKDIGFEKADDLKAMIKAAKARDDAEKSELQKAQDAIAALTKAKENAEKERSEAIEKAGVTLMRAAVMAEASKPEYRIRPEALADVWTFIDRSGIKPKESANGGSADGEYTGIGEALKALTKAKPYLAIEGDGRGTPRPGQRTPGDKTKPEPRKGFTL